MSVWILIVVLAGAVGVAGVVWVALLRRPIDADESQGSNSARLAGAGPTGGYGPCTSVPPESIIRNGLRALLERAPAQGFVVFEDKATKKFVQFAGGAGRMILDFPLVDLSEAEQRRAGEFFARHGFVQTSDGDGMQVYRLDFENDVDRATEIAMEIFRDVHGLPGQPRLYVHTD